MGDIGLGSVELKSLHLPLPVLKNSPANGDAATISPGWDRLNDIADNVPTDELPKGVAKFVVRSIFAPLFPRKLPTREYWPVPVSRSVSGWSVSNANPPVVE